MGSHSKAVPLWNFLRLGRPGGSLLYCTYSARYSLPLPGGVSCSHNTSGGDLSLYSLSFSSFLWSLSLEAVSAFHFSVFSGGSLSPAFHLGSHFILSGLEVLEGPAHSLLSFILWALSVLSLSSYHLECTFHSFLWRALLAFLSGWKLSAVSLCLHFHSWSPLLTPGHSCAFPGSPALLFTFLRSTHSFCSLLSHFSFLGLCLLCLLCISVHSISTGGSDCRVTRAFLFCSVPVSVSSHLEALCMEGWAWAPPATFWYLPACCTYSPTGGACLPPALPACTAATPPALCLFFCSGGSGGGWSTCCCLGGLFCTDSLLSHFWSPLRLSLPRSCLSSLCFYL